MSNRKRPVTVKLKTGPVEAYSDVVRVMHALRLLQETYPTVFAAFVESCRAPGTKLPEGAEEVLIAHNLLWAGGISAGTPTSVHSITLAAIEGEGDNLRRVYPLERSIPDSD